MYFIFFSQFHTSVQCILIISTSNSPSPPNTTSYLYVLFPLLLIILTITAASRVQLALPMHAWVLNHPPARKQPDSGHVPSSRQLPVGSQLRLEPFECLCCSCWEANWFIWCRFSVGDQSCSEILKTMVMSFSYFAALE